MNYTKLILFAVILIIIIFVGKALFTNRQSVGPINTPEQKVMKIESNIFLNNGNIPIAYTCNGAGMQPSLQISGVPDGAKSLALIVHDPDAPMGEFVHWVIWNIGPNTSAILNKIAPLGSIEGYTGLNKPGWVAPCPPSGVHHYIFNLYALDTILSIPKSSNKADLLRAMGGHIIENATLTGLYGKQN